MWEEAKRFELDVIEFQRITKQLQRSSYGAPRPIRCNAVSRS